MPNLSQDHSQGSTILLVDRYQKVRQSYLRKAMATHDKSNVIKDSVWEVTNSHTENFIGQMVTWSASGHSKSFYGVFPECPLVLK